MKSNIILLNENEIIHTCSLLESYKDVDRQIKLLTKDKTKYGTELKEGYFATHDEFSYNGRLLATYYAYMTTKFNRKKFDEENPGLYEKYEFEVEERRFIPK